LLSLGALLENISLLDSQGLITKEREQLTPEKRYFATDGSVKTLSQAIKGADVFIGLSKANVLQPNDLLSMADSPIVFALANPDPEIDYNTALQTRKDIIMATGRSDYPNQVNNVLGFPYIFRGALDVWATTINEEMKLAAVKALATLSQQPVPQSVKIAYDLTCLDFSPGYFLPKPLDPRLLSTVSSAVAKAAMDTGVAQKHIANWDAYKTSLSWYLSTE